MTFKQNVTANRVQAGIRRAYDAVETALWAALFAFLLYFAAFVAPGLPKIQAQIAQSRAADIAAEHRRFCQKWFPGTDAHRLTQCMDDLQRFRASVEQRLAEESLF